ncbi:MAG: helix-turn-helix transcriptional regulator [Clostridiales Family XIII bacterium]|jgi:AraC-like DNA-binding protein|nr:helix-turn-helix transcriptional regulator [Clostridiales Family XIII bacterium]
MRRTNIPVVDLTEREQTDISFGITENVGVSIMNNNAENPHRHPFYEILYIEETDGCHVVNYTPCAEIHKSVFLLCPGQVHYWENPTYVSGMLIYFDEEFLLDSTFSVNAVWELNLFKEMCGIGAIALADEEDEGVLRLLKMMHGEFQRKEEEYASTLRALLNVILIRLFRIHKRECQSSRPHVYSSLCEEFRRLVLLHAAERRPVRYYAQELSISMGYLNELVKRQTGLTPGEVIRKTMVAEAKRLIANTDLSMTEIAEMLGFRDGSYFCRLFKKEMGISPIKFRQTCASLNEERFAVQPE